MGLIFGGVFLLVVSFLVGVSSLKAPAASQAARINIAIAAFVLGIALVTIWAISPAP